MNKIPTSRPKMMQMLGKHFKFVRPSENFSDSKGKRAIWVSGEDRDLYKGRVIFDYWAEGDSYVFGILREFSEMLEKKGWYGEWHDAGTMFIHPISNEQD